MQGIEKCVVWRGMEGFRRNEKKGVLQQNLMHCCRILTLDTYILKNTQLKLYMTFYLSPVLRGCS